MEITYRSQKDFTREELESLYLSVDWSSGHYPDKLVQALRGSDTVVSAWDGDLLVGLANAIDDGVMTAYVHWVLVRPEYQGAGVGRELMRLINERYADYLRIVLIAYESGIDFYTHCGYARCEDDKIPMQRTTLWN